MLPIAEPFETMVVYGSEAVLALGIVTMLAQGRPLFRRFTTTRSRSPYEFVVVGIIVALMG